MLFNWRFCRVHIIYACIDKNDFKDRKNVSISLNLKRFTYVIRIEARAVAPSLNVLIIQLADSMA